MRLTFFLTCILYTFYLIFFSIFIPTFYLFLLFLLTCDVDRTFLFLIPNKFLLSFYMYMTLYLYQYLFPINFYNNQYTSFSYFYCSEKLTVSFIFSILDIFYFFMYMTLYLFQKQILFIFL